jgi:hypothetical protein
MRRTTCYVFAFLVMLTNAMPAGAAEQGQMGELLFTSASSASNNFDVTLQAAFQRGSERYTFLGFYAGGNRWKVRYNLPSVGTWTYWTHSSNDQLNDKTGTVDIAYSSLSNKGRLIQHGRALTWQNTGESFFIMGQTAYGLAHRNIPWQLILDWLQGKGFTLVRMDLVCPGFADPNGMSDTWLWGGTPGKPDFAQFNIAQWDKLDAILSYGLERGLVFELGPKVTQHLPLPGPDRTKYLRYLASRLGAYPHLLFLEDFEIFGPVRGGVIPSQDTIKLIGNELLRIFEGYPHQPLIGVHTRRNDTYYEGSTDNTLVAGLRRRFGVEIERALLLFDMVYYHQGSSGLSVDFRHERWLTVGIFHERWKMEGFGILQHGAHFKMPMYVGEAVYENPDSTVVHGFRELDYAGIRHEIVTNPGFYYRRYAASVILSGGLGITYGLQGHSVYHDSSNSILARYFTGYPASEDGKDGAEGYKDIRKVLDYFRAKRLDVNKMQADDTRINNGFSRTDSNVLSRRLGLKRAKFARIEGRDEYYAYNPYHTDVTITGIPAGLSIEIANPQTGETYQAGKTNGGTNFKKPSQFSGDYLLQIS